MKFNKETIATLGTAVPSSGLVLISSGTITDPVEFLDITLPDGYTSYHLKILQFVLSTADALCGAFSIDKGTTFYNDNVHHDSYDLIAEFAIIEGTSLPAVSYSGGQRWDSLMYILANVGTNSVYDGDIEIIPGDTTYPARTSCSNGIGQNILTNKAAKLASVNLVSLTATIPPVLKRANLLRLLPYGTGYCNPPTSGETIDGGSWTIFGVQNT